jgi:peptidoglycan/xylan/chitin deacetylase (PgdA/CDA1 family)
MRIFRPFFIAGLFYPEALFRLKSSEKQLCLTFDDGPDPESSPEVLDILNKCNVKAMFFCNGRAAEKYPDLIDLIKSKGHLVGNHGYNHLDGWRTTEENYITDTEKAAEHTSSTLFRPPYGRLKLGQYRQLKKQYKIVFWDLMPYDFDKSFNPAECYDLLLKKIRPGSIIVLHDQQFSSLIPLLHQFIETANQRGYRFVLPESFI